MNGGPIHEYIMHKHTRSCTQATAAKLAKLGDIARTVEHGIDIMDDANVTIDALESGVRIRDKQQRAAIMQKLAQRAPDEPPAPVCSPAYIYFTYFRVVQTGLYLLY